MDSVKRTGKRKLPDSSDVPKKLVSKSKKPKVDDKEQGEAKKQSKITKKPALLDKNDAGTSAVDVVEGAFDFASSWDEAELLSNVEKVPRKLAQNFVKLLTDGCTLPFIARYRKSAVDNLMPDRLQELFESYQNVCAYKKKVKTVLETLKKTKKLTPDIEKSILSAQNLAELDLIYAPLKTNSLSLAERARKLGLEQHAIKALDGAYLDPGSLCTNGEELATPDKVEAHVTHIVADIIYKDARVLEQMRLLKDETRFTLQSTRTKSSLKPKENADNKRYETKSDPETYKLYFEWKCPTHFVKPHQMLALNRGEDEKILTVKVIVPDWYYNKLERFCLSLWKSSHWVKRGLTDAYSRLIKPWLSRQVRSELTSAAHKEAVKTFTSNLEKYLLTEPVKNRRIAGLDPGFKAGCKVGIIDTDGQKLDACTIHPNFKSSHEDPAFRQLKQLLEKHGVQLIGLGNGTACRETESWLKNNNISTEIPIVIVPEQGASIYSISKEAQKVDPKHLGVGMYQHDVPPKQLEAALACVVETTVSLVGVDVNTASHALLRRISGLNENRAKKILEYRSKNGPLHTREDILKVSGIGKVTYQQCAGFLKVTGGNEPLDATVIHPESYAVAKAFAKKLELNLKDLTKPDFPAKFDHKLSSFDLESFRQEMQVDGPDMELIVSAFKQKSNADDMISFSKPVYSISVQNTEQLKDGMSLTGVVRNVVPFGCFVDCGVGDNGLIHTSQMQGHPTPRLGDRVAVTVVGVPRPKKLQLRLDKILD
ncbi:hypothetical protein JYU34_007751 [Plutella xylostella]|uniref:S1 motif domain-containing protein n=1 Tax=Plutella xylostella TaxID=51655 RepID=A0ABQ7QR43_PLUXY|nr:hypothetical protein JYU34_007751 [Plutella xylostella]